MEKFKQYLLATALLAFAQLLLMPSLVMAQTVTSVDLVIIDATDKTVSSVLGTDIGGFGGTSETTLVWVALKVDDRVVTLVAHRNGFVSDTRLGFTSADCSTTPLMAVNNDLWPPVAMAGTNPSQLGNALYIPDLEEIPQMVTIESTMDTFGGAGCIGTGGGPKMVVPAIRIADLDNYFTPPFTVIAQDGQDLTALQQQVDDLEDQVDDLATEDASLQQQITTLEGNLMDHRHGYLTGQGKGHNSVSASTGPAFVPAAP